MTRKEKIKLFNEKYPVGSAVTITEDNSSESLVTVKAPAQILAGHTAVVWLTDRSSCYLLDRIKEVGTLR